jgi:hypothetical protein
MTPIPSFIPAKRRVRRKRKQVVQPAPAPPVVLTLVAATYQNGSLTVVMQFNKAIDISEFDGGELELDDGTFNHRSYVGGDEATLVNATTMQVSLASLFGDSEPGVFLTVGGESGIVAVDGSGEWAGCSELALPFGP